MIVLSFTATTAATNPLAFATEYNTNTAIGTSGTNVQIKAPGMYEIVGTVNATSTAVGQLGINIDADGSAIGNTFVYQATAEAQTETIPIYGAVEIKSSNDNSYATISFVPVGSPTIVSGTVSIKKIV